VVATTTRCRLAITHQQENAPMSTDHLDVFVAPLHRDLSRRSTLRGLAGLSALLAVADFARPTSAQEATPTPAYAPGVHAAILGRKEALAAPGYNLQLARITFDPGSKVAPHTHPGDTVTFQLAGSHAYTLLAGEAYLVRAGTATPTAGEAGESMAVGQEYTIAPGDVILFDAHTAHTGRNPTDQPAVLLEAQLRAVGMPLTMPMGTPTP
jgi:quercetin dioxygenase-like cupin family protein